MATLGSTFFDLIDLYKNQEGDSRQIATVIELLKENNAILDDAVAMECNMGVKHRTTIRTGLPTVTWGQFYQGISQSKSTTAQVDDATGFVEQLSSIDTRLLNISGNPNAVRLSEATASLEAIAQEVAATLIYGNDNTAPQEFLGFAPRFNSLSAVNGGQIERQRQVGVGLTGAGGPAQTIGGHAQGMRQYLGSETLQSMVAAFWDLERPVAAICHGVFRPKT